ncbi:MAG TPA: GNAT family N-acetyltransferase [Thermopetrobacter sp.]|nr:GNAT family N-acetyltransferase [Thermopetrobacter sp.]
MNIVPTLHRHRLHLPDGAWRALENEAAEAAFSAARDWLGAGLLALPEKRRPLLLTARDGDGRLVALCGTGRDWRYGALGPVLSTRWGDFFCHGVPLISREAPEAAALRLLATMRARGGAVAEFASVPLEGPFAAALTAACAAAGLRLRVAATWRRAALDARMSTEAWWRDSVRRRRRKEWNRLRRRLEERGETRFETLPPGAEVDVWLDEFLLLEAAGWKGRAGTALACSPEAAAFTREALRGLAREKRVRFWRLRHAGRTIASLFAEMHGDTLLLGKIAYDEALAAFSPGVLLTLHATRDILADEAVAFADSCAAPNHPMIDHIWPQRRTMADILVQLPEVSPARAEAIFRLEAARRRLRAALKAAWHGARRHLRGVRRARPHRRAAGNGR